MSRTYSHVPCKFLRDEEYNLFVSHEVFRKHINLKNKIVARKTRRKVRHALIDEENVDLINAIAEYKLMSCVAKDRNW
jgi:hypothetical protein